MPSDAERDSERVNQIYDSLRKTLLNKKYYGRRLATYKAYNFSFELLIALGATGSGGAGFAVWQTSIGTTIWAAVSGLSAILAIAKPLLKLTEQIEIYAKLYGEYTTAFEKMKVLIDDLQVDKVITLDLIKTFNELRIRSTELAGLGDPRLNQLLISECEKEVNLEINVERLWDPGVDDN